MLHERDDFILNALRSPEVPRIYLLHVSPLHIDESLRIFLADG
jgi:hypothetical protein